MTSELQACLLADLQQFAYRVMPAADTGCQPMMTASDNDIGMRAIVDLPKWERDQLDALCRQQGMSRAEAIRQALRLWLQQQTPSHAEVFDLSRDRPEVALELQQALRQGWS